MTTLCANCKTAMPSLKTRLTRVNTRLHGMLTYFDNMGAAFRLIDSALVASGFEETNGCTETAGTETSFHGNVGEGKWLHITWYRMESGRYEVTAYVN